MLGNGKGDPVHSIAGLDVEEFLPRLDVPCGVSHLYEQARQLPQDLDVFLWESPLGRWWWVSLPPHIPCDAAETHIVRLKGVSVALGGLHPVAILLSEHSVHMPACHGR